MAPPSRVMASVGVLPVQMYAALTSTMASVASTWQRTTSLKITARHPMESVTASSGFARPPTTQTLAELCAGVLSQIQHISVRPILLTVNASLVHANSLVEYAKSAQLSQANASPIAIILQPQKSRAPSSVVPLESLFTRLVPQLRDSFSQALR